MADKMRKLNDTDERIRLLVFGFRDIPEKNENSSQKKTKEHIDVIKIISQKFLDDQGKDAFSYMKSELLKDSECAYVLYDWQYRPCDCGPNAELVFIMW